MRLLTALVLAVALAGCTGIRGDPHPDPAPAGSAAQPPSGLDLLS